MIWLDIETTGSLGHVRQLDQVMTLLEVSEHCASLRRGYRADLVRVTSLGYVTIEVYRAGGLLASSTGQDVVTAMRPLFADLPS